MVLRHKATISGIPDVCQEAVVYMKRSGLAETFHDGQQPEVSEYFHVFLKAELFFKKNLLLFFRRREWGRSQSQSQGKSGMFPWAMKQWGVSRQLWLHPRFPHRLRRFSFLPPYRQRERLVCRVRPPSQRRCRRCQTHSANGVMDSFQLLRCLWFQQGGNTKDRSLNIDVFKLQDMGL